jgi:hypothetical protein
MLRVSHLSGFSAFRQIEAAVNDPGALALLNGETDGFAIDATIYDSVTAASYTGGPVGGTVATIDTATPANDLSDVALDRSNIVQSGTSARMVHWPTSPYVRWTPHNLLLQSQTFGTTWSLTNATQSANSTTAPDGTTTADSFTEDSSASALHRIRQDITGLSTALYTFSLYVKSISGNYISIGCQQAGSSGVWFGSIYDLSDGSLGETSIGGTCTIVDRTITSVGSGWYLITITGTISATDHRWRINTSNVKTSATYDAAGNITYTGTSTIGFYLWGAHVNRGYIAAPYLVTTTAARIGIPQGYDIAASKYGLLVEPAATNLLLRSDDLTTTWTNTNSTEGSNATTAPDGSTTADSIIEASDTAQTHGIQQTSASLTSGTAYTFSVYLKQGTRTWARLDGATTRFADNFYCDFNLGSGAVGTLGAGCTAATITAIGDGWYRCTITATCDSTGTNVFTVYIGEGDTDITYNGDGAKLIYMWGAQLEAGSIATSYIPTVSATVTRAVDSVNVTPLSSIPFSQTAGTLYVDNSKLTDATYDTYTDPRYVAFDDGTNTENIVFLAATSGTDNDQFIVRTSNTVQAQLETLGVSKNTRRQMSGAWAANDVDASYDGAAVASDGTATVPPAITQFHIGNRQGNDRPLAGYIYRLVYVPRQVETEDGNLATWRYNF